MGFAMTLTGMEPLRKALDSLPAAMRHRVIVPAATKAIKIVERAIASRIPVNKRGLRRNGLGKQRRQLHYRTSMTSVVREYPLSGSVVALAGAESGKAPHAHLAEEGTVQRFTNSKPVYRKIATGVKSVLKRGKLVTRAVRQKKSIGSTIKKKSQPQLNRGRMPALHPVALGVAASSNAVSTQLANDIRSGITRELTAAQLARGI